MERETATVPATASHIDVKLAAIGVVRGIVAALAMDSVSRLLRTVTGETPSRPTAQSSGTVSRLGLAAAMGVNYMLASEQAPDLRRGYSTV